MPADRRPGPRGSPFRPRARGQGERRKREGDERSQIWQRERAVRSTGGDEGRRPAAVRAIGRSRR
eukprot:6037382-Pyramimonas_sp.AAC.1